MKKCTITLLFIVLSSAMHAQDIHFGITAGPNLGTARMNLKDAEQPRFVMGFQLGAFAEWAFADKISLRPELQYISVGYKFPPDGNVGFREKIDYVTLPLMVEYGVAEKLKVGLGPYVSAKIVAKYKFIRSSEVDEEFQDDSDFEYSDADNDEFQTVDFGLGAGIGYQLLPKFGVGLRYNHGLSNIFKISATDGSKVYNRFITLGLSYTIR